MLASDSITCLNLIPQIKRIEINGNSYGARSSDLDTKVSLVKATAIKLRLTRAFELWGLGVYSDYNRENRL